MCSRCILDLTVPDIKFDENGICNYCRIHDELEKKYPIGKEGDVKLNKIIKETKNKGKNKKYDCIVGLSGGCDSTYTLYLSKQYGLRPLAIHFDNGWNSDIAVTNIKNATNKLNVDLFTVVADWEEFKDLQISFLKASVPDAEIPTDYAIISILLQTAAKEGVKYILEGHSFRAEGTTPIGWSYMDGRYLKSVHKKFGKKKITSFPILSISTLLYYTLLKKIKFLRPLEFMDYTKENAKKILKKELDWIDYGGHHHESIFTKFFQSYYLIKKFNIDKRKRELSAQIRSGRFTRKKAIEEIENNPYPVDKEIVDYTISKLDLTNEEFNKIMNLPPKTFLDYPTYYPTIRSLRYFIKLGCKFNLFPEVLYQKYAANVMTDIRNHWANQNKNGTNVIS